MCSQTAAEVDFDDKLGEDNTSIDTPEELYIIVGY
jgi:hypothetical protein